MLGIFSFQEILVVRHVGTSPAGGPKGRKSDEGWELALGTDRKAEQGLRLHVGHIYVGILLP